ncbi:MAG TPA: hypothetical protein VMR70_10420 [Flavisolibacter sp.]|nr:hypothetical protein [Flavisolibacter sp.]
MFEFLQRVVAFLNAENIPYMLSGSVAMSVYIVPRATKDMDIIVHLEMQDVERLTNHFSQGYYYERESIREAVKTKGMFNIIDHASGFKADFIILKNSEFRQTEFRRRQKVDFFGTPIYIVSVEDLLLSKLIWIQELQSGIQIQDIEHLLQLETLDKKYIRHWIRELNLNTFNLQI